MVLYLFECQGVRVVADILYVSLVPAGMILAATCIIAIASRVKLGWIWVRVAGNDGFTNNGRDCATGVIDQHGIAGLHLIA